MNNEFMRACDGLINDGVALVASRYDGDYVAHAFHNSGHTLDVVNATRKIIQYHELDLSPEDRLLLPVAAAWHDSIHDGSRDGSNEHRSAAEVADRMRQHDIFTTRHIDRVADFVMTTIVSLEEGRIIQSINPDDLGTLIIADADLSSLGMPPEDAIPRFKRYFQEISGQQPTCNGSFMNYLFGEIALLEAHRFHTEGAQVLYSHTTSNAQRIQHVMQSYAVQ